MTAPRGGKVVLRVPASEANFPVSQAVGAVDRRRPHQARRHDDEPGGALVGSRGRAERQARRPRLSGTVTVVVITRGASYAARLRAG